MKLIISRHGEAEDRPGKTGDHKELTTKGADDIKRMAEILQATGWKYTDIRFSPLKRARQTAEILSAGLSGQADPPQVSQEPLLQPGIELPQITRLLNDHQPSNAVIWVFHAPDVARLASHLTRMPEEHFYFPAGSMLALNLSLPVTPGKNILLVWHMQPQFAQYRP